MKIKEDLVNDKELKKRVAKKYRISYETVDAVADGFKKEFMDEVSFGRGVRIKGIGSFKIHDSKPFKGVNVNTKELMIVDTHKVVKFTPTRGFRNLVRYGYEVKEEEDD